MALIQIKSDGSFEAVAATPEQIKALKDLVRTLKSAIKDKQRKVEPLKRVAALKLQLQQAQPAKAEKIKDQISALRNKYTLGARDTILGTQRTIKKLEGKIERVEARITKAQIKQADARKLDLPRNNRTGDPRRNPTRVKTVRTVPRKVSFDTGAKRAATQAAREIKGELARLGKEALAPSKKPAAGVTKHAAPANSAIQGVLKVINQLKRDIAGGLTGTKLAHAKAELAKQRSSLRTLRKGQSAKNQAAVTKTPATKNMGKAKPKAAATTPVDLKALRATMTELHKKVMAEKDATKKAALEKRYKAAVAKFKKMRLVK